MNANITSKYHVLLIGLVALTAFSNCTAMQEGDSDSRSVWQRLIPGKRAVAFLIGVLALTSPQGANGVVAPGCDSKGCYGRDELGRYRYYIPSGNRQQITTTLYLEACNGSARCTSYRWFREYPDGRFGVYSPEEGFFSEDFEWICECENSDQDQKQKNSATRPTREKRPKNRKQRRR